VASSPRDISVFFGRHIAAFFPNEGWKDALVYERQIIMTVDLAEDLIEKLTKAVETFKSKTD
jgi:hypothetical protein